MDVHHSGQKRRIGEALGRLGLLALGLGLGAFEPVALGHGWEPLVYIGAGLLVCVVVGVDNPPARCGFRGAARGEGLAFALQFQGGL